ncbi:hypothetical protein M0R45_026614 [Rubus argutus]|uniref:Uncharacterized protein n=1 Tax=Rubus argutus TaxID=59490 RepID=A0AAW1X0S0_RUBAR
METSAELETTSYLWLRTNEGTLIQVEKEHALSIPWIGKKVAQDGSCGTSRDEPITLPALVTKGSLDLLPSKIEFANHEDHHNGTKSKDDLVHMRSITDTRMTEGFLPKLEQGREILLKRKLNVKKKRRLRRIPAKKIREVLSQ